MNIILIYFAIKYQGNFKKILHAIKNNEVIEKENYEWVKEKVNQQIIKAITIIDEDYPEQFKFLEQPPFVIFYEGKRELLTQYNEHLITLTGEHYNKNVEKFLEMSLSEVAKTETLVTKYFKGVDEKVVNYFREHNKPIIYVSANGVRQPIFANKLQLQENEIIISEYPTLDKWTKATLRDSNRLIAALASNLVLYSSQKNSGINNLINYFLVMGKEVNCFPGDSNDHRDGNNILIEQGAKMITSIKNIYKSKALNT